jgi:hypothetical protein
MVYAFSIVDPVNRFCEHTFAFRVYYSDDEMTLLIASGLYRQQFGF